MTTAAVYTRISSDPTRERLGVQRQEDECRALCDRLGWRVGLVYEDDDQSAYSGKPRRGYMAMLEAIAAGEVDAVVAWHPDRLHRSPTELEDFIALIESTGTKVQTAQAGEYDLSTPSGRMSARIVGAVARGESEHKAERAKAKARQLAKAGKVAGGGSRPFGYEVDRVTVRLAEAKVLREVAARFIAGESLRSLAADLNQRGITTTTGKDWRTGVLSRLLRSARIAGWRSHHGELVTEAEWPAIITLDQHHAIGAILSDPARLKRRTTRRYLLTGMLYCARCDAALVARPRSDKRKQYVCAAGTNFSGCGKLACLAQPLDDLATAAVLEVLRRSDLEEWMTPTDSNAEATAERIEVEKRLDDLATMFAAGDIGQREWMTAREGLDARLSALRADESAQVTRRSAVADVRDLRTMGDQWDDLPIQRQRSVLEVLLDRVVLSPAVAGRNFFDPDRVDIRWRY